MIAVNHPPLISVVSPVYNAEGLVDEFVARVQKSVEILTENYEIVLVDDRSEDDGWARIITLAECNERIKAVRLSKNFGQHQAIAAGLSYCKGEWVVVMDCDLQDRPEEIPFLFAKAREGYKKVLARRANRQDPWFKKNTSWGFYQLLSYLTDSKLDPAVANFGIYHRTVINAILSMKESVRYFPLMIQQVGFSSSSIDVAHSKRPAGKSSYNLKRMVNLSADVIISYSNKPLHLMLQMGLSILFVSVLLVVKQLLPLLRGEGGTFNNAGVVAFLAFFSGLILSALGITSLYLSKVLDESKSRPSYLVESVQNIQETQ